MAKLYYRYGAMKSGKSIDVIRAYDSYEKSNRKAIVMKPEVDTRDVGVVRTRKGYEVNAITIPTNISILDFDLLLKEVIRECSAIIIDEAQFLTKHQVYVLSDIVDNQNIPILCYGLKTDFRGNLFEGSKALLEIADNIEEIKTVCQFCPKKAIMNLRVKRVGDKRVPVFTGEVIEIGDEEYIQTCRKCYRDIIKKNQV